MSFRTLMAIAAEHDLELEQMDAVNAFVHAPLDDEEVIFMRMPPGSLRTTPLAAPLATDAYVVSRGTGIQKSSQEPCVMVKGAVTVFFYVDDIIWAFRKEDEGSSKKLLGDYRKDQPNSAWRTSLVLGIRILRDRQRKTLWLTQDAYIDKIAYKFLLNNDNAPESLKLPDTPMISDEELLPATSQANEREKHQYLQKVGSVLFSAISTRPDIAFAVSRLARHNHNPDEKHQKAADRVILFLFATRSYALRLGGGSKEAELFLCSSDASFADNSVDRKSSQGYVMTLFGGSVA
ncbi:polyprotein [Hirsutella rhossiliensis]|uniref:Polyprotein n=1 Tax=Hirsutella rhossiliensis TaxID=111463 RepID=A0A9P8MS86_9HYPO|nr:polyprotein [Hirsutella rhossiliensis]KAH0961273.1 polyprotein [Hirsutella rhossiliensis]